MAKTTSPPAKSLGSPRILATSSIEPYSPLRSEKSDDTDLDNDGADVSISTAKTSPNTSTASGSQKHAVAEVIAESFPPYDHQSSLVAPFERELELGVQFREHFSARLLSVLLKTQAWSTSRQVQETENEQSVLEKGINNVIAVEGEQGRSSSHTSNLTLSSSDSVSSARSCTSLLAERTRERLRAFVSQIKLALATLSKL